MNKTCAIYVRVSSDLQDVKNSVSAQLYSCENYAKAHDYSIYNTYIDEAKSGKNPERDAYQELKKDAKEKKFNILLADKSDRLGRDVFEVAKTFNDLQKLKIELCFARQLGIIDTPEAKLQLFIMASLDEYYSQNLGQEVKKGQRQVMLRGFNGGGYAPYGYKLIRTIEGNQERSKFEINEEEAIIVRRLFEMSAEGKKVSELITFLKNSSLRQRKGHGWTNKVVFYILNNRFYTGQRKYIDTINETAHPALISQELFDSAKKKRGQNRGIRKNIKRNFLLTGVAKCAACGGEFASGGAIHGKNKYYYYRCKNRVYRGICSSRCINAENIETKVRGLVEIALKNFTMEKETKPQEERSKKGEIKRALAEVERKKKNIINAIAEGFSSEDFREELDLLKKRREELQAELQKEEGLGNRPVSQKQIHSISKIIKIANNEDLKPILKELTNITFNLESKIGRIEFNHLSIPPIDFEL